MPTPKSVTKVTKDANGHAIVQYTSEVDKAEYMLYELTRAALRDVGKFVMKTFYTNYYQHFKKRTGEAGKSLRSKVWSSKSTIYPRVEIGLKKSAKGFYSMFQEFGTSKTKKLGLLTKAVEDNIATIRQIESKYLDYINSDTSQILANLSEGDIEDEE